MRLEETFNLHPGNDDIEVLDPDPRVKLHHIPTTEDCFNTVIKYVQESQKNQTPTIIIVDSIATLKPAKEYETLMDALEKDSGPEDKWSGGYHLATSM